VTRYFQLRNNVAVSNAVRNRFSLNDASVPRLAVRGLRNNVPASLIVFWPGGSYSSEAVITFIHVQRLAIFDAALRDGALARHLQNIYVI